MAAYITRAFSRWHIVFIVGLALLVIPSQMVFAATDSENKVTPEEAYQAALSWLHTWPSYRDSHGALTHSAASEMQEIMDEGQTQTVAYVLHLEPAGYIIVTPDFRLNPIIAFSESSPFKAVETERNVLLGMLRSDIPTRIQAVEKGLVSPSEVYRANSKWESSSQPSNGGGQIDGVGASIQAAVKYGPFLTSKWDQGTDVFLGAATFNYYTPPGDPGDFTNYPAGCVATALGQLLNYYEWPLTGTDSHSYLWNSIALSADFGATTYPWAAALDDYTGGGASDLQRQAAGLISYQAGVAVDMNYGLLGSGADTAKVAGALQDYFRSSAEWVEGTDIADRLFANMVNGRPGELAIRNTITNTGHAVVVDGVQYDDQTPSTKFYHLNLGWSGYSTGWYDIEGPTFKTGPYTWNQVRGAVLDIVPNPDMADPGGTIPDSCLTVSWDVAALQNATSYELQQRFFPDTLDSVTDDAEGGIGEWTVDGYWTQSPYFQHQGSYSFQAKVYNGSWYYPGTLTLNSIFKVADTSTISYYWGAYWSDEQELRLELSVDGITWNILKSHIDTEESLTWLQETVTPAELAAYVGEQVQLRFVVDQVGGSTYVGDAVGYFVDEIAINNVHTTDGWSTVEAELASTSTHLTASQNGEYFFRTRASGCNPSMQTCTPETWDWSDEESVTVDGLHCSTGTGSWGSASTWDTGTIPGSTNSAIIEGGHTISVDGMAQAHDLTVKSGGAVEVPSGITLTVADEIINSGTLQQTQTVDGSTDVGFFDTANHGGVVFIADGTSDLGNTQVTIQGNQTCTVGTPESSVRRCLSITPSGASPNAQVRFYFSASELGDSIPCEDVNLWHWNGSGWNTFDADPVNGCSSEPYYVQVTGVDDFSPFVADNNTPDGPPPLSVALTRFDAWANDASIQLEWETVTEINTLGFNLYRSAGDLDGEQVQLNDTLILTQQEPGSPGGSVYTWVDRTIEAGIDYYYVLEVMDSGNTTQRYGPTPAVLVSELLYRILLPLVGK